MLVLIDNFLSEEDIDIFLKSKRNIDSIINKVSEEINNHLSLKLYPKWVEFLTMNPGSFNGKHVDIDTDEEDMVAAILYLNNNFTGGELVFKNIKIRPKAGQLIFFNSNKKTPHSVLVVNSGKRMSLSMFFDKENIQSKYKYQAQNILKEYKRNNRPI